MSGKRIKLILDEMNESNGSNHKIDVLKKHVGDELFKLVLKMTYDKVAFTYGITFRNIEMAPDEIANGELTLAELMETLNVGFATRAFTGNEAAELLKDMMRNAEDVETAEILRLIVRRDLRVNVGRSNINKVFKDLIIKPLYMRCGTYNEKTAKKFNVKGAFVQLKADGSYREFNVTRGSTTESLSRQGEPYEYSEINESLEETGLNGIFIGELTVYRDGILLPRSEGNGLLKKNELPDDCRVIFDCWDIMTHAEYANAKNKIKGKIPYHARWGVICKHLPDHTHDPFDGDGGSPIRAIECIEVEDISEALRFTARVMNDGLEGAILKERNAIVRDGTSLQQLKLKVVIQLEVRATGFHEGTPGTVREDTFGSITYETDDKKIKGRVSGFTNDQLKDYNSRRDEIIGKVMTVECNDITKGRNNDHYALSHPRFIEERDDKDTTDTLESALEAKESAMHVDEITVDIS